MSDVDAQIERARAAMERIADGHLAVPSAALRQSIGKRLTRIAVADVAILVLFFVVGLAMPGGIGIMGALVMMVLLAAATLGLAVWPAEHAPAPEKLATVDVKILPAQTSRWLAAQRAALPAPARSVADAIGKRLDVLSPQLGRLGGDADATFEVRRLVGEQLPALVNDYARVPVPLRGVERNGKTPDGELVDGLRLIEGEIAAMTERLAQGDLDSLATRGRYLEMKYRGEGAD